MTRQPIESSNIAAIGYDVETQVLEVEFKPNRHGIAPVWQYTPVGVTLYEAMMDPANSAGGILAQIKRDAGAPCRSIAATKVAEIEVAA